MAISYPAKTYILRVLLLGAAQASTIYLSLFLVPPGGSGASLVWPPAALGLAALALFGIELWPGLFVSVFLVLLFKGNIPPVAAGVAFANTAEGIIGALLLKRFDFDPLLSRLQDALALIAAAALSTLFSSMVTPIVLSFIRPGGFNQALWLGLWVGHAISIISFAPFFIRWAYKPLFTRTPRQWAEGTIVIGLFVIFTYLIYWTTFSSLGSISLLYISIIPLIWIALRAGPRGMSLALVLMAVIGTTGVLFGDGPIAHSQDIAAAVFGIQLVIGILSIIFVLFSSIVEERKEATLALQSHVGQLEVALDKIRSEDQAKSDFIAILAHELRNPLSPILSGLELLKSEGKGPEDVLQMMGAHLTSVARLLDDLLDISRVSQKKFKLQREPLTLQSVISQSVEMASPTLRGRDHTLTTVLPEEELWVHGDPVRLSQVVVNLLNNAAKYTNPGGKIRLEVSRMGSDAVISIADNGIGIEQDRLGKIFEPFGVNDDAARRGGGLHIGLSLAKRMVELHNGTLEAKSGGSKKGSTFIARIPLMTNLPLPIAAAPQPVRSRFSKDALREASQKNGSLKILVVDDNEAAADSLSRLLVHNGHKTLVAYDAPQALSLCESNTPQVALLDIGLPTMDGYQLAERLRARFGNGITLVALTGYGQAEDKQKAKEAGFDGHLTKPVSVVDVERVLSQFRA